jgi:hypothetical protein
MIRFMPIAFALIVATSAEAMTLEVEASSLGAVEQP